MQSLVSPSPSRTVTRCLVCGFAELRTDTVVDRGLVLLSECPRCEHRSTRRVAAFEPAPVTWPTRVRVGVGEEAAAEAA